MLPSRLQCAVKTMKLNRFLLVVVIFTEANSVGLSKESVCSKDGECNQTEKTPSLMYSKITDENGAARCMSQAMETGYVPAECEKYGVVVCNGSAPACPFADACGTEECSGVPASSRGVLTMNASNPLLNIFKVTADFVLKAIPEVGPLLAFLFDTFFGLFTSGPKSIDVWALVKDQVELLVNESITDLERQTLESYLKGWNFRLLECNATTKGEELCNCLLEIERDMTGKIPFFFKNDSISQLGIWLPYAVSFSSMYLTVTKSLHAKNVICSKEVDIGKMLSDNACACANFVHESVHEVNKWRTAQLQNVTYDECNMLVARFYSKDNYTKDFSVVRWCYCTDVGAGCEFKCDDVKAEADKSHENYVSCVTTHFKNYWLKHAYNFADEWKKLCMPT